MKSTPTPAINKVAQHQYDAGDLVDAHAVAEYQYSELSVLVSAIQKELALAIQVLSDPELTDLYFRPVDILLSLAGQTADHGACHAREEMQKYRDEWEASKVKNQLSKDVSSSIHQQHPQKSVDIMMAVGSEIKVVQSNDIKEAINCIGYAANHFNELGSLFSSIKNMIDMGEYVHVSHLAEIGKQQAFDKFIFFEEQENDFKNKLQISQKDVA